MLERLLKLPTNQNLFLFGPRNTGKSTLIRATYPDALLIDLLDYEEENKFASNPKELKYIIDALPDSITHVIIDEIQKVPKLLDTVHQLIESSSKYFILTGSSARKIKRGASNMLAGRAFVYYLYPFSSIELKQDFNLNKSLAFGTLPKIYHYSNAEDCQEFLKAYALTYLKEEIWAEHFINKLDPFRKFLEVSAQMNGKIINLHKISLDVGVDEKTVKAYFTILEDTLIGFFLEGFQHSVRKSLLSKPKFYFFDTGVQRALSRQLSIPVEASTYQYGNIFEHFIILECYKLASYSRKDYKFNYYMTKDGVEIDLVVTREGKDVLFIEIKSSSNVKDYDLKALRMLKIDLPDAEFVCFSNDQRKKIIEDISVYPWQEGLRTYFL